MNKTIINGFKFGSLLQLAIGPICIYIFNTAIEQGFLSAFFGVIGVVLIDSIFIALSLVGISSLLEKREMLLKLIGSTVLILYGCYIIYHALFDQSSIANSSVQGYTYFKAFTKAVVLTGSSPLTIIFWSGVFSTKIVEDKFCRRDEIFFGLGAVLSTFVWLNIIAIIGLFTSSFLNDEIIKGLNVIVGIMLIYFGAKLYFKKKKNT